MNPIRNLILLAFAIGAIVTSGCSGSPKSPARIAHTTTVTAITTADAAISAWADYVVAEQRRIAALKATDPGAALEAGNRLLVNEGKVSAAYYRYQAAATEAITAGASSADPGSTTSVQIAGASTALIQLIATLTTR